VKALVVGLGSIGRRHARNWHTLGLGEVWVSRATSTPLPEPLGVPARQFRSLDEALAARPDVVIVTNPTSLHPVTTRAALGADCHVLVEKPLGATLDGIAELLSQAARSGRLLAVGYNIRFHPGLARTRSLLEEGAVGRPLYAHAEMGEYLPDWHPWEDYRQGYSARRDLGGGPILTSSHELDSLCWLLGVPETVSCTVARVSGLAIETEDMADLSLRFGSGVLASIHLDFVRRPPRRFVEVVGEEGVLRWEYDEGRVWLYSAATREWRVEELSRAYQRNDMFLAEMLALADSLSLGSLVPPLADGRQGAAILAISLAAVQSAAEQRTISLRDFAGAEPAWLNSLASQPIPRANPFPTFSGSTAALR
jgi:predicted dehydrogenase